MNRHQWLILTEGVNHVQPLISCVQNMYFYIHMFGTGCSPPLGKPLISDAAYIAQGA
jgi:hypothetical protein